MHVKQLILQPRGDSLPSSANTHAQDAESDKVFGASSLVESLERSHGGLERLAAGLARLLV